MSDVFRFALQIKHFSRASKEWGWERDKTRGSKTSSELLISSRQEVMESSREGTVKKGQIQNIFRK